MDTKTREDILRGALDLPLFNCELRQRGASAPIIYKGPGFLSQTSDRSLLLRVFSEPLSVKDGLMRLVGAQAGPGMLVPETGYYDFRGDGQDGSVWTAERLSLHLDPGTGGTGTYLSANVPQIERAESFGHVLESSSVSTFVPGTFDLPWHLSTTTEESFVIDRFEGKTEGCDWKIRKRQRGLDLNFAVTSGPIERRYRRLLLALEILSGRAMDTPVADFGQAGQLITRVCSPRNARRQKQLSPMMPSTKPYAAHANAFVAGFLTRIDEKHPSEEDHTATVYWLWHRVSKAYESDIENSALVLSVGIESLLDRAFKSEVDQDEEFLSMIEEAETILKKAGLQPRVLGRIESSLASATKPGPKQVLRRLKDQGFIGKAHVLAWEKLRNKAAHGKGVDGTDDVQILLEQYHHCIGLFYCLIFVLTGYRGVYSDLTRQNWPDTVFGGSSVA